MGISGLLPFVKKASREINVTTFAGQTVAVDAYCWLHKGAFSCAEKLVKGEPTDGYVLYVLKMVTMLLRAGLTPILVFDGQNLPSKRATELKRRENREKNRRKAKELLREGKVREARECFQRCIDITPQMAREVILACRAKGVDCLVAPYEADAQLAYLCKTGIAQVVITEDSDLIIFGCERIVFKMDSGGHGILVEQSKLHQCLGSKAESFTFDRFRYTCILSGCDYLDSLPGIGLVKAAKFFSLSTNPNLEQALSRIPSYLRMPKLVVSTEYKRSFVQADNTFLYQLVFCPLKRKLVPLNAYPFNLDPAELHYAGKYLPNDIALELAKGNINVSTLQRFPEPADTPKQNKQRHHTWNVTEVPESIWSSKYKVKEQKCVVIDEPKVASTAGRTVSANLPKSIMPTSKKRKLDLEVPVISGPSNQELLSMYGMGEQEQPLNSSTEDFVSEHRKERSPLLERNYETEGKADCKTLNRSHVFRKSDSEMLSPAPIVRSRFFWTSGEQRNNKSTSPSSLWDKIEQHSTLENTPPQKRPTQMAFAKLWPSEHNHLKSSPKVNSTFKPVTVSTVPNSQSLNQFQTTFSNDTAVQDDGPNVEELDESILSQKSCDSDREEKTLLMKSCDTESSLSQHENLSQLTVCSIDRDSFGLSQSSQASSPCVDLIVIDEQDVLPSKKLVKNLPSRKVGLSKKKQGPLIPTGQLSLKQAFEKFRFKK